MTTKPPVRLFDAHAHLFTSDTTRYPIDVTGAAQGEEHVRNRLETDPVTPEHLFALWDKHGVTGGAAVQYNSIYKTDNSYCIDCADAYPDRVSAVLILHAHHPESPAKLRDLASNHNVSALRLFGFPDDEGNYPWLDSPAALETWDVVAELGLHMVLMYVPGKPTRNVLHRIIALSKRYPETKIILDHCGWPWLEKDMKKAVGAEHRELIDFPNILFKFTEININRFREPGIDAAAFVREMIDTFGPNRVFWGSDYGNTRESFAAMVERAIAMTSLLNDEERASFLHDNGARLFAPRPKK
ncbi:MAG: amidohydrolase [Sphingobium sp.]